MLRQSQALDTSWGNLIKFRGRTVVLYPLAKYQAEVKPLYGKRIHVIIIAEE